MSVTDRNLERASKLGEARAKHRLTQHPNAPLPEEPMDELWEEVGESDLYFVITGDKYPVYSTTEDAFDREQLALAYEDAYYDYYYLNNIETIKSGDEGTMSGRIG